VQVIDAPVSIAKERNPVQAARNTPQASVVQAAKAVGSGQADAFVCGGSTGAALASGLLHIKRCVGIHRPALALPVPVPQAPVLLLDVGANSEARAEHLVQFAYMGNAFAQAVLGIANPRIALLSNGEEPTRGTEAVVDAHRQLAAADGLRFIGNVEGVGVTDGVADVVVSDGFTGNVALKMMEGISAALIARIRDAALSSRRATLGGMLLRPALHELKNEIDPERVGGAYMLGLRRLGVVCHGRFTAMGIASAIEVAERGVREQVVERTTRALEYAGALRSRSENLAVETQQP
jgi:glycerol-3-phosphate acyltransferase PlsX